MLIAAMLKPNAVADWVKRMPPVWKGEGSNPNLVKPMTYEIDTNLSIPSLALAVNRIGQGLVSSVSG